MTEDQKRGKGMLFSPVDPELKAQKLRAHNLNMEYNQTYEHENEKRAEILSRLLGRWGKEVSFRDPYGSTTASTPGSEHIFSEIST